MSNEKHKSFIVGPIKPGTSEVVDLPVVHTN